MEVSVAAQAAAFAGGIGLGFALGLLYDLMRVIRIRLPLRWLGGLLDLLFWLAGTAALFLWTLYVERGLVRIYTILSILLGGTVYFLSLSRPVLRLGHRTADLIALVLALLIRPLVAVKKICKKIWKKIKNIFHYGREWYKIKQITREMDAVIRFRAARERGGDHRANQKNGTVNKNRGFGTADLLGHISSDAARANPGRPGSARHAGTPGQRSDPGKHRTGRRHREQR